MAAIQKAVKSATKSWNWNDDGVKPVATPKNIPYPGPQKKVSTPKKKAKTAPKFSPVKFQKMQKKVFGLA